jgi:hypothetical protein
VAQVAASRVEQLVVVGDSRASSGKVARTLVEDAIEFVRRSRIDRGLAAAMKSFRPRSMLAAVQRRQNRQHLEAPEVSASDRDNLRMIGPRCGTNSTTPFWRENF